MDEFLGSDYFSGGGFGDDAIMPDLDLQNAFQSWLSDGNEGTFSDFMAEANGQDASSSADASGNDAASDKTDTSLIAPERDKFEYGGLLSGKPMIGLDRSIMQPSEAAPSVSGRSFMSFAGVPTSRTQPLDAQPIGDQYGPPIMPLTVENSVNVDRLTPAAQGFLSKIGSEHFPGLSAISGFRDSRPGTDPKGSGLSHNEAARGATNSRHTIGDAIDFDVSQLNDEQKQRFMNIATDSGARGIGVYPSGRSVHVDFRETPAVWGGNRSNPYSGNQNPSAYPEWAQPTVSAFASGGTRGGGFAPTNPFGQLFAETETKYGLPTGYLTRTAAIETGGTFDPFAQNRKSSAGGLFQFTNDTAKEYGLQDRFNPEQATDAAGRLARNNATVLRNGLGREPTAGELYLAHQQGATGALNLLNNPDKLAEDVVGRDKARLNAGGGLTSGQFSSQWINKFAPSNPAQGGSAADLVQTVANSRGGTSTQQLAPKSYEERMAGIGAVPANPNGFTPASLPEIKPNTSPTRSKPAEFAGDSAGLLSPNMAIPGNVPMSNVPTMPGAIDPRYIYQRDVNALPAQAPPMPPGVTIKDAPIVTAYTDVPAPPRRPSDLNTGARRMNELPPEYFTADTGGSGMGAMRFMESEFARRDQSPAAFGGLGAAISGGAASVGSAVRNALGLGGGEALPPPPRGQEPVARAMPVGDQRINPPLPQLGMITWGEGGQRNAALMERWRGQVAEVDELERRGIPRAEAVALINSPRALELRLARVAEEREKRERAEFLAGNRDILGGQAASPPAAPATGPAPAPATTAPAGPAPPQTAPAPNQPPPATGTTAAPGQPATPPPISAINEFDARRERINRQIADLTLRQAAAPNEAARKQQELLIKGLEKQRDAIPDPVDRRKRDLELKKLETEIEGGRGSRDVQDREKVIRDRGLDPNDPRFQAFILTGRLPREDQQPLTATDRKAILEADEGVLAAETAIKALTEAKALSPRAYGGWGASARAAIGNNLPDILVPDGVASPSRSQDTASLNNLVVSNALSQLKAIFGGVPTEGERKILLEIQGSVNQPDNVRQEIYSRAASMAEKRLQFNKERASQLRGGDYYKAQPSPRNETPSSPAAPNRAAIEEAARAELRRRGVVQ